MFEDKYFYYPTYYRTTFSLVISGHFSKVYKNYKDLNKLRQPSIFKQTTLLLSPEWSFKHKLLCYLCQDVFLLETQLHCNSSVLGPLGARAQTKSTGITCWLIKKKKTKNPTAGTERNFIRIAIIWLKTKSAARISAPTLLQENNLKINA